jgi:hypothetical protein
MMTHPADKSILQRSQDHVPGAPDRDLKWPNVWRRRVMNTVKLGAVAFATLATIATAQSQDSYDGTWKATFKGTTRLLEARVVIKGTGGSWKTFATSRDNRCIGLEAPITVTTATADALNFAARFSDVIAGCENFTVEVKRDGAVLKGTRGGVPVEMVRN